MQITHPITTTTEIPIPAAAPALRVVVTDAIVLFVAFMALMLRTDGYVDIEARGVAVVEKEIRAEKDGDMDAVEDTVTVPEGDMEAPEDVEALPEGDVEALPEGDMEALPEGDVEALPEGDMEAPEDTEALPEDVGTTAGPRAQQKTSVVENIPVA